MTTTPQPEFQGQNPQSPQGPQDPHQPPQQSSGQPPQQAQTPPPPPYQPPAPGHAYPGQAHPSAPTAYGQQVLEPQQQRTWGMLSHVIPLVAMVLSAGLLGFVGSLVIYVMYKDRGDFVRQHAANSLNIQIITGIILLISFPLMLILVGFATYFIALAVAFVLHVIGALRANEGQQWTPPMTPAFVK